jgi:trimethylamine:corrinoid methyltransferase-like protein
VGQHYLKINDYRLIAKARDNVEICDLAIGIQALSAQQCWVMQSYDAKSPISFDFGLAASCL